MARLTSAISCFRSFSTASSDLFVLTLMSHPHHQPGPSILAQSEQSLNGLELAGLIEDPAAITKRWRPRALEARGQRGHSASRLGSRTLRYGETELGQGFLMFGRHAPPRAHQRPRWASPDFQPSRLFDLTLDGPRLTRERTPKPE